jgi:FkbM family methyltransferase
MFVIKELRRPLVQPDGLLGEDPDFDIRFRHQRLRRWACGVRRGMSLPQLVRFRLGLADRLVFAGVPVAGSETEATYRLIEDLWMRGEYDIPGVIPQPGWRVVDIGANVGIYGMLAARRGAWVVCYEPHPETFRRLEANTAPFGVECHRAAVVGERRDEVILNVHPLRDTRNTLLPGVVNARDPGERPSAFDDEVTSVTVPAVPIADVLDAPADLVKIACEGGEFELIAHARDGLARVRRLVIELHTEMRTPYGGADELIATLRDAGFRTRLEPGLPGMSRRFLVALRG